MSKGCQQQHAAVASTANLGNKNGAEAKEKQERDVCGKRWVSTDRVEEE